MAGKAGNIAGAIAKMGAGGTKIKVTPAMRQMASILKANPIVKKPVAQAPEPSTYTPVSNTLSGPVNAQNRWMH